MAKTFEVAVYQTAKLSNHCYNEYGDTFRAQKRAKEFIEGAFAYSEHYVNVLTPSDEIYAPQEIVLDSFEDNYPCTNILGTFSNLGQWWDARIESCSDLSHAGDVDLLLTNYDSEAGICVDNQSACAEGGQHVADLPSSHDLYGCTRPYDSMQTALHELAHGLMTGGADGFVEHNTGYTYDHSGTKARTPMANPGGNNECGNYVDNHDGCDEMRWSECCESKMKHT